ncbi:unnamed protein product [Calicophoron daubneyi]|uniref:Uncharacterized protein n=1 Tax=Calicophoron daubneyi TaxID=300641 RepID=A0AAV2T1K3_CALDB
MLRYHLIIDTLYLFIILLTFLSVGQSNPIHPSGVIMDEDKSLYEAGPSFWNGLPERKGGRFRLNYLRYPTWGVPEDELESGGKFYPRRRRFFCNPMGCV